VKLDFKVNCEKVVNFIVLENYLFLLLIYIDKKKPSARVQNVTDGVDVMPMVFHTCTCIMNCDWPLIVWFAY